STDSTPGIPALATSWSVSPDGTTWTLPLRPNARWQDLPPVNGRPFTSADVAWMVDHQQRGGILRAYWTSVTVETPDPHTVVFRTKQPDADFLSKLSEARNAMAPHEVAERDGDF